MPKIAHRISPAEQAVIDRRQRDRDLVLTMEMYRNRMGIRSWQTFAEKARIFGLSSRVVYSRMKNPETLTLREIREIVKVLEIPDEVIRPLL